jgi:hypothetical protein
MLVWMDLCLHSYPIQCPFSSIIPSHCCLHVSSVEAGSSFFKLLHQLGGIHQQLPVLERDLAHTTESTRLKLPVHTTEDSPVLLCNTTDHHHPGPHEQLLGASSAMGQVSQCGHGYLRRTLHDPMAQSYCQRWAFGVGNNTADR